mmetsp:Transcript_91531/g.153370  ORF Transcript_91531/g.153370 Transcript_91531/m.153370 type:complete len:99 (+) Transcript_91531:349-645(+)
MAQTELGERKGGLEEGRGAADPCARARGPTSETMPRCAMRFARGTSTRFAVIRWSVTVTTGGPRVLKCQGLDMGQWVRTPTPSVNFILPLFKTCSTVF